MMCTFISSQSLYKLSIFREEEPEAWEGNSFPEDMTNSWDGGRGSWTPLGSFPPHLSACGLQVELEL